MHGKHYGFVMMLLALGAAAVAQAQEDGADRLTVPFSDPARPGVIRVGLLNGSIRIVGHDAKEVLLEARVRSEDEGDAHEVHVGDEGADESGRSRSAGMRRLRNTATGLEVEEEGNVMEVRAEAMNRTVDVALKVPRRTSLELNTVNDGDITVESVEGDIEVNNTNGAVTLTNVSGSVVAHALNEDVVVRFVKVDPKKSMSFSSLNGDIDVTLPADVRANVRVKSDNGDVFTDFDMQMERRNPSVEETKEKAKGKKYRVRVDSSMSGTLNGGGQELRFETFNGSIYIRKKQAPGAGG